MQYTKIRTRKKNKSAPLEKESLLKRQSVRKWKVDSILPGLLKPKRSNSKGPQYSSSSQRISIGLAKISHLPRLLNISKIHLPDANKLFLIGTGALALLLAAWALQLSISETQPEEVKLELPVEEHTVSGELLAFASPDSEARGSGDINFPERPIVTSVDTHTYTVKRGDTLSEIAAENNLDVGTLISFNKIDDVRRLMAGSEITIPDIDGVPYTVQRGDSLEKIANRYQVTLENILDANDLQTALIQPGQKLFIPGAEISEYEYKKAMGTLFIYPTSGRLTSGFGYRSDPFTGVRRMHYGVDLANRTGTAVNATMSGRVVAVGSQPRGYGKYVVVKHNHGFQSLYGHLSSIDVSRNQYVSQGQRIGRMGNSGRSTGSHLHFSLYKNNVPVNPLGGYLYQ